MGGGGYRCTLGSLSFLIFQFSLPFPQSPLPTHGHLALECGSPSLGQPCCCLGDTELPGPRGIQAHVSMRIWDSKEGLCRTRESSALGLSVSL